MATIKIQRASGFINRPGSIQFYIDGQLQLSNYEGTTEIIEVAPGSHTLIAKSLWVSSQELSFYINYNETKAFEVGAFKLMKLVYLLFIFMFLLPFLHSTVYFKSGLFLLIPLFAIILYYSTFGHNEYFILKEL